MSPTLWNSAEGDEDDFIASDDDVPVQSQPGKHRAGRSVTQACSIKDWPDSCSETSQDVGTAKQETQLLHQQPAMPDSILHARQDAADSGATLRCQQLHAVYKVYLKSQTDIVFVHTMQQYASFHLLLPADALLHSSRWYMHTAIITRVL